MAVVRLRRNFKSSARSAAWPRSKRLPMGYEVMPVVSKSMTPSVTSRSATGLHIDVSRLNSTVAAAEATSHVTKDLALKTGSRSTVNLLCARGRRKSIGWIYAFPRSQGTAWEYTRDRTAAAAASRLPAFGWNWFVLVSDRTGIERGSSFEINHPSNVHTTTTGQLRRPADCQCGSRPVEWTIRRLGGVYKGGQSGGQFARLNTTLETGKRLHQMGWITWARLTGIRSLTIVNGVV